MICVFWASLIVLGWTYVGYTLTLRLLANRRTTEPPAAGPVGQVSLVIAVKNEEARLAGKLRHLLELHSPALGEIIIVCDHCTDQTAQVAHAFASHGVKCIIHDSGPAGKAGAINAGVAAASGELVLFNDVRQELAPGALERLAAWFHDPQIGAVSGSLEIQSSSAGSGKGLDTYWKMEKRLRHDESALDSSIGCTGAIYMIRRELYQRIPADTLLDDVVIPMLISEKGFRVRFEPQAQAFDPQPLTGSLEARRKIRTLAGNFQMLFRYPHWLLPWRHRLWFMLLSHKYLRVLSPVFLAICLATTIGLLEQPFFQLALSLQLILGLLAIIGMARPDLRARAFALPAAFFLLQLSATRGFFYWITMHTRGQQGWK